MSIDSRLSSGVVWELSRSGLGVVREFSSFIRSCTGVVRELYSVIESGPVTLDCHLELSGNCPLTLNCHHETSGSCPHDCHSELTLDSHQELSWSCIPLTIIATYPAPPLTKIFWSHPLTPGEYVSTPYKTIGCSNCPICSILHY